MFFKLMLNKINYIFQLVCVTSFWGSSFSNLKKSKNILLSAKHKTTILEMLNFAKNNQTKIKNKLKTKN